MKLFFGACLAVIVMAAPAAAEILAHIVYTPTSLPSAQGWMFNGQNLEEDEVFSLDGGVLVMDTMGTPMNVVSSAMYQFVVPEHADAAGTVVRWRARVTASEAEAHAFFRGFGFSGWPFSSWHEWYWFNLDSDALYTGHLPTLELDTGVWRDYALVCSYLDGAATLELTVDGQPVTYPEDEFSGAISGAVMFGDRSQDANARVEIAEIEIIVSTDAVATAPRSLTTVRALFAE